MEIVPIGVAVKETTQSSKGYNGCGNLVSG